MLTFKEIIKQDKERAEARTYCKHCGHSTLMTNQQKKKICSYCGNLIFANKEEEFKYRMKESIIKEKRENK